MSEIVYTPARTATERRLTEIWQECLGVLRVGIHDDFYVLGGNSIVAMQILNRLLDEFQFEEAYGLLLEADILTIATLAAQVDACTGRRAQVCSQEQDF